MPYSSPQGFHAWTTLAAMTCLLSETLSHSYERAGGYLVLCNQPGAAA